MLQRTKDLLSRLKRELGGRGIYGLVDLGIRHAQWLCWLLYFLALLLFCVSPFLAKEVFFDEKPLLAGKVIPRIQKSNTFQERKALFEECKTNVGSKRVDLKTVVLEALNRKGMGVSIQNFTKNGVMESSLCQNLHTVVHTPRGDGKEGVVIVSPLDLNNHHWTDERLFEKLEANCMTMSLGLTLLSYLSSVNWLSKNIIWLIVDSECEISKSIDVWLSQYHSTGPGRISRGGVLGQAIVLDLRHTTFASLEVSLEGYNGHLVKLELYWLIRSLAKRLHNMTIRISSGILNNLQFCAGHKTRIHTMMCSLLRQTTGIPSGPHANFHKWSIEAITIKTVQTKGNDKTIDRAFVLICELLECVIRCFSNLIERINRSYYYYLLVDLDHFIPIEIYIIPVVMLLLSTLLKATEIRNKLRGELFGEELKASLLLIVLLHCFCILTGLCFKYLAHWIIESETPLGHLSEAGSFVPTVIQVLSTGVLFGHLLRQGIELKMRVPLKGSREFPSMIWIVSLTFAIVLLTIYVCLNWCLAFIGALMVSSLALTVSSKHQKPMWVLSLLSLVLLSPFSCLIYFGLISGNLLDLPMVLCLTPLISFAFWSGCYIPVWMTSFWVFKNR